MDHIALSTQKNRIAGDFKIFVVFDDSERNQNVTKCLRLKKILKLK